MKDLIDFFRQGHLWDNANEGWHWMTRLAFHSLRRLVLTIELFLDRNLMSHAAALTYSTVLGAVPILAIIFAIARGFGFGQLIEEKLRASVRFTPEMTATIMDFVNSYLDRAQGGFFIGAGLLILFYTLYSLSSDIELAFNQIWQVKDSRNIYRRAVDYISIFFLLPIVIVLTSGLQIFLTGIGNFLPDFTFVSKTIETIVVFSPYALAVLAFIFLYRMMPNTQVKWRSTIFPGILAGLAFQGLQWFYIHSQIWLSSYNAVYGSFAAIPLFMLWVQLSWTICLFGAQLSYAHQMEDDIAFEKRSPHLSRQSHDKLATQIMRHLYNAFEQGQAMTAKQLSVELSLPLSLVSTILDELASDEAQPLVSEVLRGKHSATYYQPARPLTDDIASTVADYFYSLGDELAH